MFPKFLSYFLLLILTSLSLSQTLVNITLDDQDPRMSYIPSSSWVSRVDGTGMDYGGGHMLTEDLDAYATITLQFVSFYVLAPKWPYPVTTNIAIDGGDPILVDMQDYDSPDVSSGPSSVAYGVVTSWIGTASEEHTLRFSIPPGGPGYAVVDGIIFETLPNPSSKVATTTSTTTSTSTSSTSTVLSTSVPTSTSSGTASSQNSSKSRGLSKRLTIIIAALSSVFAILLICLISWCCIRCCGRDNPTGGRYTGIAHGPPMAIDDDEFHLDGYDPYLQMTQPAAGYAALPPSRNRARRGGQQSLDPSSQQDGLASVAQSVVGRPRFYG